MNDCQESGALVVLSGGQDSTTALYWAISRFKRVAAIPFDYGQRHRVELECATKIAAMAGVPHEIIDAHFINTLAPNALTRDDIEIAAPEGKLPTTFVDGRNLFFLTMAAVYAKQIGHRILVIGVSSTDYSGYPDCRPDFISSAEKTISLAMDYNFFIAAPMMYRTKAEEVRMAVALGEECMAALAQSHTCYAGKYPPCGKCPACELRAKGFKEAGVFDPLLVRAVEESWVGCQEPFYIHQSQ
jgi:7-cyano-7-deazaguanine synthase